MAKAPAKPAAAAEGAAPPKSKKGLIIIIAVVLIVAIGGGVGFMMMKGKSAEGGEPAKEAHKPAKADHSAPPVFVTLEPFTTNLAKEDGDHYVQIAMVLKVSDAKVEEELKQVMPELRHRVNLMLASKLPSQLGSTEGREELADEFCDAFNEVLGYEPPKRKSKRGDDGPIEEVLFNSFIIQ